MYASLRRKFERTQRPLGERQRVHRKFFTGCSPEESMKHSVSLWQSVNLQPQQLSCSLHDRLRRRPASGSVREATNSVIFCPCSVASGSKLCVVDDDVLLPRQVFCLAKIRVPQPTFHPCSLCVPAARYRSGASQFVTKVEVPQFESSRPRAVDIHVLFLSSISSPRKSFPTFFHSQNTGQGAFFPTSKNPFNVCPGNEVSPSSGMVQKSSSAPYLPCTALPS